MGATDTLVSFHKDALGFFFIHTFEEGLAKASFVLFSILNDVLNHFVNYLSSLIFVRW